MKKILCAGLILFSLNFLFAEKIIFSANSMSGQSGSSSSTTILSGNAYIKTESMEIQADTITLSGEDYRNITAEGNVSGKNTETKMDFTCNTLSYDRETKIATLEGNVNLIDTENSVNAQAQLIEYNRETDIAILQIKINLTQKDNICSGSYAVYHKQKQLLEISGNAQVKQKEDTFRAQYITLDMETQDITLGGNVKGTVTTEAEKKEKKSENINKENIEDSENANLETELQPVNTENEIKKEGE